jgi:molecular chaperone DnaK
VPRVTVDFGIDLEASHCVLAVYDEDRVTIIPNSESVMFTPPAVQIDRRGNLYIGRVAKERAYRDPDNTANAFRRLMVLGADAAKHFKASGRTLRPAEPTAVVLKSLRDDAYARYRENIDEVVITVPADFGISQTRVTVEAAQLAGFRECTLLQRPIAAALAYGISGAPEGARWLVYNFSETALRCDDPPGTRR